MKNRPATVDDFLAALTPAKRATLGKLRRAIKAAAPEAEECISYGIPAFRHEGRVLVFFGGGKHHCSFYPGAHPIAMHKAALKGYRTSKGTVRFPVDEPLPAALVRKLVKARIAEQAAKRSAAGGRSKKERDTSKRT